MLSLDLAFLQTFDLIHTSPPCQALSSMRHVHNALPHLNLIPATRAFSRLPVAPTSSRTSRRPRAPDRSVHALRHRFQARRRGRQLQRHRLFETSFPVRRLRAAIAAAPCLGSMARTFAIGGRPIGKNHVSGSNLPITVGREAIGIDWMTGAELSEAIPPVYSHFVARAWLAEHIIEPIAAQ